MLLFFTNKKIFIITMYLSQTEYNSAHQQLLIYIDYSFFITYNQKSLSSINIIKSIGFTSETRSVAKKSVTNKENVSLEEEPFSSISAIANNKRFSQK